MMKVACVQMNSGTDIKSNIAKASELIRQAHNQGAELIATPETTDLRGRSGQELLNTCAQEKDHPALHAFIALAEHLKVWLLIGSLSVRQEPPFANGSASSMPIAVNRSYLLSPQGKIAAYYDKIHLFDATVGDGQLYRESLSFRAGKQAVIAQLPQACLGLSICYDLRFPELYLDLSRAGAEILAVPAAFTQITGEKHWHILLRARAIESGSFVIAPAQCGDVDGKICYGHSLIVSPDGLIRAEGGDKPEVITAELDLAEVKHARTALPCLSHRRPFRSAASQIKC